MTRFKAENLLMEQNESSSEEDFEDGIIKDSVLKLTSNEHDSFFPNEFTGAKLRNSNIASQHDIETEYKGVAVSRKSHDNLSETDVESEIQNSDSSDNLSIEDGDSNTGDSGDEDVSISDFNDTKGEKSLINDATDTTANLENNEDNSYNVYSKIAQNATDDIKKGNAIRHQISIWERMLECRIKLQKSLLASNSLPRGNKYSTLVPTLSESNRKKLSKTCTNIASVLKLLIELKRDMINNYPEFLNSTKSIKNDVSIENVMSDDCYNEENDVDDDGESVNSSIASGFSGDKDNEISSECENDNLKEPAKKKLKLEDFSKEIKNLHEDFIPARNKAIQKWNDKTRISSGSIKSADFSAFDQSTLKQIEQILSEKSRLIKRTQTKRAVYNIVGEDDHVNSKNEQDVELDSEIFDDNDFYHKILREFIEQKSSDVMTTKLMGQQWIELQKLRSKMKRSKDVKATKGRRLRYTVHSKLVNFMAPISYYSWTEEAESELYSSLFGEIRQK